MTCMEVALAIHKSITVFVLNEATSFSFRLEIYLIMVVFMVEPLKLEKCL